MQRSLSSNEHTQSLRWPTGQASFWGQPIRVLATLLAPTTKVLPSHVRVGVMVGGWMEGVLS